MLDKNGFDLWAGGYDKSVGVSDHDNTFPFAGYKSILNEIYNRVLASSARKVLDIGLGTGTLTARLYDQGCEIYGQDFSDEMIKLAHEKMPEATLFAGDFTDGLAAPLKEKRFDAIIATYSLHHLEDEQKVAFLSSLLPLLNEGGAIYIGDVAFSSRHDLDACKLENGDRWDDDEFYFVYDELSKHLPKSAFEKHSFCSGLITIAK